MIPQVLLLLWTFAVNFRLIASFQRIKYCTINRSLKTNLVYYYQNLSPKRSTTLTLSEKAGSKSSDGAALILEDFEHLLQAITIYKEIFGDLDIPVKFDVPCIFPWPTELYGLRLGRRLQRLFSSPIFMKDHPDKVRALQATGLNPTGGQLLEDWDIVLKALKVYLEIYGDLRVPVHFVVPEEHPWPRVVQGLKLGTKVASMRGSGTMVRGFPERKALLDGMGFEWKLRDGVMKASPNRNDESYELFVEAIELYKANFNNSTIIPEDFYVPKDEGWPVKLHGLKLGALAKGVVEDDKFVFGREDRKLQLQRLGFKLNKKTIEKHNDKKFNAVHEALIVYKQLYGDFDVPIGFVVPSTVPWPEHSWSLKLGNRVFLIRSQGDLVLDHAERREKLASIGFDWESTLEFDSKSRPSIVDGYNTPTVGSSYTDSNNEFEEDSNEYNEKARAEETYFSFGSVFKPCKPATRSFFSFQALSDGHHDYKNYRAEEEMMMRMKLKLNDDDNIRGLAMFAGGKRPGSMADLLRAGPEEEALKYMKYEGYRFMEFGTFRWREIIVALKIFKSIYGHIDVPVDYIISKRIKGFELYDSKKLEGLKLGQAVFSIRVGDVDAYECSERKAELDSLSFKWGMVHKFHLRYRFYAMYFGLRVLRLQKGRYALYDMVNPTYKVPDNEPLWPSWSVGMPLGEWIAVCRLQESTLRKYYPERVDMLREIGFVWKLPKMLPLPDKYKSFVWYDFNS